MNKFSSAIKWTFRNLFLLTVVVFIVFYLRWFHLTPFVVGRNPASACICGCALLGIYGALIHIFVHVKSNGLKALLAAINIFLLGVNALYLYIHMPHLETTARCNGARYYITYSAPLGDEQWTYVQMSKWRGISYQSYFWGYAPEAAGNEIRCDIGKKETLFLRLGGGLIFIDGENPQRFYKYAGTQLKNNLYFMSEDWHTLKDCNREESWTCDVSVYTLYKCKSNYTDCNPLPITYTSGDGDFLELRADDITNEVSLYLGIDDETLVFTYGENSRCYVDGCTINGK